ncbi:Glucanosyltransferase-domain-containing protein [Lophiotrema nucula]|uniref:1,3-beta-glucanosyltransferase n=1 Tax=Lophiotrema nucula TaxID=690887 RepID=A0A6A5ZRP9_9PLEO|nr:Glucanosyltransferase-domain-containing protein [Lophiotrema nucula]
MMPSLFHCIALLLALFTTLAYAVHPVEVRGQDFVDTVTGKRVMVIGVDYQPGGQGAYKPQSGADALSNGTVCLRDAALLQRLGINTIRVYNVDPTIDHNECASIFNAVGIYMIIDVNSPLPGESINRADPGSSYTTDYLTRVFGIVENFKGFPNTLAFFSANEVMNEIGNVGRNPQYIRAVQRDLKNYIAKHSTRTIPVGYSAADVREILEDTWSYLQCAIDGDDKDATRSDFFGLNSYSWCGDGATYQTAGYDVLVSMFQNSSIPVLFSEYGCNKPENVARVFNEVTALYGPDMTSLSGGLVYEYSQEESDFGLVNINENTTVTLRKDYDNLQGQYNKLDLSLIQSTNASATQINPPECSAQPSATTGFSAFTIPKLPDGGDDLINNGIDNPTQGKLVPVTETNVPMAAYGSTGEQIQNLAIRPLETTSPSGTGSPAPTPSKKGGGSMLTTSGCGVAVAMFVTVLMIL